MGTYVLALWLERATSIPVGRLGLTQFPAGWYLYVGSALGPGGLRARLGRHCRRLSTGKKAHWHIDYLREVAVWGGAWALASERRLECTWAQLLLRLSRVGVVAPAFGASDCHCPAHLIHLPGLPEDAWFARALGAERFVVGKAELDDLLEILVTGDDDSREAAARSLKHYGLAAVEPLARLLQEDKADTRWWAARALAEIKEDSAIPPLIGALSDGDPDVRACAALALGRMGAASAAADATPALAACLADESAFVASIAADGLSMIGEPAIGALTGMLADDQPHARLLAVRALGRIKSQEAIGPLFGALDDPSYLVCYYAQEALEALGVGMVLVAP